MIVGTSMGSIIGGLYAIGYTTEQLDSIFTAQDWNTLLSDKAYRNALNLQTREQNSQYILSVPFFEKPQDLISGGVIKGRNIGRMLWQLTEGYHDSIDFQKMPIPFACISQDLVTGEEIVFRNGVLPIAIVKTIGLHALLRAGKDAANPLLRKGIALFGAANAHFKHIPALDLVGEAPFLLHKPHFLAKC